MIDEPKIKEQAKQIMDEFLQKLEQAEEYEEEYDIHRDQQERINVENDCDEDFWDRALENAPNKTGRTLQMEKKKFHTK